MAKSFPFESKLVGSTWDRAISAQDERDFNKLCWTNGVFPTPIDGLVAIAAGGMRINIKPGGAHIEGARFWEGNVRTVTLSAASNTLPRIDRIVLRFDTSEDQRKIDIQIKEGVPATKPSPQDLIRQPNYFELAIADIYIPARATEITASNITDRRPDTNVCGIVIPAIPYVKQSEDLWSQIRGSIELVNSALDGSTAAKLKATIGNSAPIGEYNAPPSFRKMTEQITSYTYVPKTVSDATDVLGGRVLDLKKQVDGLVATVKSLESKKGGFEKEQYSSTRLRNAGDTWVAPSDGILVFRASPQSSSNLGLHYIDTTDLAGVNNTTICYLVCQAGTLATQSTPVRKGYTYKCGHSTNIQNVYTWFFPCK